MLSILIGRKISSNNRRATSNLKSNNKIMLIWDINLLKVTKEAVEGNRHGRRGNLCRNNI